MYSSYEIRGDSYVKLACRASGGDPPPRVAIYRHGLEISAGNQVTTLNYVIRRTEQNVTFQCKSKTQDITQVLLSNAIKLFSKGKRSFPHPSQNKQTNKISKQNETNKHANKPQDGLKIFDFFVEKLVNMV